MKEHKRQNLNKYTNRNVKLTRKNARTAHVCVCIFVHNCCTQHSTQQFWLSSLLSSRQAPELRCGLLEGRGSFRNEKGYRNSKNKSASLSLLITMLL